MQPGRGFNICSPIFAYTMPVIYFNLPLQLEAVLSGHELPTTDLESSIKKNLEMIIMTKFGEHRSDPSYGCEIWDLDFGLIVSPRLWEEKLRQSLLKSIATHEYRINGPDITVTISDIEKHNSLSKLTEVKKRVQIKVEGLVKKTGESFAFETSLFLSPLSVDR